MFKNTYGDYDAELVRIAMAHAKSLVGTHGFTEDDADDIAQTLIIAGLVALPRFDKSRGKRSTFLYAAIRERVKNLARDTEREKRDWRKVEYSLDEAWGGDESGETAWSDVVGKQHTLTENGASRDDHNDLLSLLIDVKDALAELPPKLQELCRLHSVLNSEDARRAAGMAYSSHHRAIKQIRAHLKKWGFAKIYPKKSGRDREAAVDHLGGTL